MQIEKHDEMIATQRIANYTCEKKFFKKIYENDVCIFKIITNEKYNWLNDEREIIQKNLKKLTLNKKLISKKNQLISINFHEKIENVLFSSI